MSGALRWAGLALFLSLMSFTAFAQDYFTTIDSGNIVEDGGWNYGCLWFDYDGDNLEDLYVLNNEESDRSNFLYHNDGFGFFTRITEGPHVTDAHGSYGASVADYDNDGDIDLFVANYNQDNRLYQNNGDGTFTSITTGAIVSNGGSSTGSSWIDYDNDGWLDLYVCNRTSANFLYHGNGDGTFTRITAGAIVTDNDNSSGCAWADYDGDSYPDLFVANVGVNRLYHNNGDGSFTAITDSPIVTDDMYSTGGSWGDYDNDGDMDLFVPAGVLGVGTDYLYRNDGGFGFTRLDNSPVSQTQHWNAGSAWADLDLDGDLELTVGAYDGQNQVYENLGGGFLNLYASGAIVEDASYSKGVAFADYDNDGDFDLFIAKNNYFGGNNIMFRNDLDNGNHYLKLRAVGTESNTSAIGLRIRVHAEIEGVSVHQTHVITSQTGGGTSGQSSLVAIFGLGDAEVVDSIQFYWPSGIAETYFNVSANQYLICVEGDSNAVWYDSSSELPVSIEILSCYPNPFNAGTRIQFTTDHAGAVGFEVYSVLGRMVDRIGGYTVEAGQHEVYWRPENLPSGQYFIRMETKETMQTRSVLYLK